MMNFSFINIRNSLVFYRNVYIYNHFMLYSILSVIFVCACRFLDKVKKQKKIIIECIYFAQTLQNAKCIFAKMIVQNQ